MECTKDIILNIEYASNIGKIKTKKWTSNILQIIKENKFIISVLTSLTILVIIDVVLVSSFIDLLKTL